MLRVAQVNDRESGESIRSIPNPVRVLGLARIVAGAWLVATGAITLSHYSELQPMAQRLFLGDPGTTDAPIRALLTLVTAPLLAVIGVVLMVRGFRWLRRISLPIGGPAAVERDEVIATLVRREAPAYGAGPVPLYWPLRRWLHDKLDDLTWWRRDIMGRGVRALVRSCGFAAALAVVFVALRFIPDANVLGPFPTAFVLLLVVATGAWAVLGLMLIPSDGPRIESFEFPIPGGAPTPDTIVESPPKLLGPEPAALGLTLGIIGAGVQCLIGAWWELSTIGYPLMATSIIRHIGSLAGGLVFLILGDRMVSAAAEMVRRFRYESTIVYIGADAAGPRVGHGAAVRTETRGPGGPRHIVGAVGGAHAREAAITLLITGAS
jgi:hypothetical protein